MRRPPIFGVIASALMILALACAALAQTDRSPAAIFTQLGLTGVLSDDAQELRAGWPDRHEGERPA